LKQVQSAIKKITTKENKKRSKSNSFAERRVEINFALIVGHVKTSRTTENGKDWDKYLQTEFLNRFLAKENDGVQTVDRTASASKKRKTKSVRGIGWRPR
jgi:hypothetical protein